MKRFRVSYTLIGKDVAGTIVVSADDVPAAKVTATNLAKDQDGVSIKIARVELLSL